MIKKYWVLSVFLVLFLLSSCSAENEYASEVPEDSEQTMLTTSDVPERKIIYTVESTFDVEDLDQSILQLKSLINDDEWFDEEDIGSSFAMFKIRIKTERLDEFTDELKDLFQVRSFSKVGKDISLQYQDKTNRINSVNLQIARLQVLYEDASLSDMIVINQQLSDLEIELMNLEGELNLFDSLIEYSEVNVTLYGSKVITRSPFFNRLGNAFVNGFTALITVLDSIAIAIGHIIPFVLIIGPVGYGIYYFRKKYKTKKIKNKNS